MKGYLESDFEKAVEKQDYMWFKNHGFDIRILSAKTTGLKTGAPKLKVIVQIMPSEKMTRIEMPGLSEKSARKLINNTNRRKGKHGRRPNTNKVRSRIHFGPKGLI